MPAADRYAQQLPSLFAFGILLFLLSLAFHYVLLAFESTLQAKRRQLELEIVTAGPDALVHDETNRPLAQLLAGLEPPFPAAMGVLYCNPAAPYEQEVYAQSGSATGNGELDALLNSERTWEVT